MAKRKSDALIADDVDAMPSTSRRPSKPNLIENLNALDQVTLKTRFFADASKTKHPHDNMIWTTQLYFPYNVPNLRECLKLIETTSKHDYAPSSFGWHPKRKWNEMNEKEMRYLIVEGTSPGALPLPKFGGFLSFMFTHDSTPAVPVVYIYEIHLTKAARGKGLGSFLMRMIENVAKDAGLDKVMLTCFLSNENALSFYRKHGFEVDACSPGDRETRNKVVKTDYVIVSKGLSGEKDRNKVAAVEVKQELSEEEEDTTANANVEREGSQVIAAQSSMGILSKPARCQPHEIDEYQRKLHELEEREEALKKRAAELKILEKDLNRRETELEEREDALADDAERLMSIESRLEQRERYVGAWSEEEEEVSSEDEEEELSEDDGSTMESGTTAAHRQQSLDEEFRLLFREAMIKNTSNIPEMKRITEIFKAAASGADNQREAWGEIISMIKSVPALTEKYRSLVQRQRQAQAQGRASPFGDMSLL